MVPLPELSVATMESLGSGTLDNNDENVNQFRPSAKLCSGHASCQETCLSSSFSLFNESWSKHNIQKAIVLWELSVSDQDNLIRLSKRLIDVRHPKNNPLEVVRFMLARSSDVDAAETMFRNMILWRTANKVDTILQDYKPPKDLIDYYPGAILQGLDKEGDAVMLSRSGVTDGAGMLRRFGDAEMIRHAIWIREIARRGTWMEIFEKTYGRPVKRITIIEDADQIPLVSVASNKQLLSFFGRVMRMDQDYYPETAKKLIVIRAPALFSVVWSLTKHFFDTGVVAKMEFCGKSDYKRILSKYVDIKILPDCVVPNIGMGKAMEGMPPNFKGGPIPPLAKIMTNES